MKKILLAILLAPLAVCAEPRLWGIDQLGGARYRKQIVESHPDGFALGIFTQKELFGDGYPVVDEALSKRRIPLVRYNLRWSDTHSFSRRDFPKIVAEARRGLPVVNKYPNVECEFSGATEHQLKPAEAAELARLVLEVIPERCKYVNNPWTNRGAFIPANSRIKNEVHGEGSYRLPGGSYNYSFDGTDAFDVNTTAIKNRHNGSDVFFFWTSQNNGRRNVGDTTPRTQRKFWPTGDLMRMQAYLATEEGRVSVPKNYTIKPKSDQHVVPPAPRELKPVFIIPTKASDVSLVGDNGSLIAVSGKGQPFADGRTRFYFPEYGYQIAEKAKRLHGKPTANLRVGGKVVGTVNPAFRAGSFR